MIPTRYNQIVDQCMFVGLNRINRQVFAIFMPPVDTNAKCAIITNNKSIPESQSQCDGLSNTQAMIGRCFPAAEYCRSLKVGNHQDFYLPSKNELELAFRNNRTQFVMFPTVSNGAPHGKNPSSIPTGAPYTKQGPPRSISLYAYRYSKDHRQVYLSSTTIISKTAPGVIAHDFAFGWQQRTRTTERWDITACRRQLLAEV